LENLSEVKEGNKRIQTNVKRALGFNPGTKAGPHEQLAQKKAFNRAAAEQGEWE